MKGRKQIREMGPCGAPFCVIRVHGVAGEGTEMQLASRRTRHNIAFRLNSVSDGEPASQPHVAVAPVRAGELTGHVFSIL